ncbi:hypothetical protein Tco_1269974 [Tanacetum coccineum]
MRTIGVLTYYLEIQINQSERSISINQNVKDLIKQILRNPTLLLLRELSDFSALEKYFRYLFVAKKESLVDKVAMFSVETGDISTAGCMLNIDSKPEASVLTEENSSKVTDESHMSHSWICMSMCDFVAFVGAQSLVKSRTEQNWFN